MKYEEAPTPEPSPGHVLIKVLAAGVNRFDHYIREGSVTRDIPLPHVLGADAAGEVAALGEGVTGFEVGERVVPMCAYPTRPEEYNVCPISAAPSFRLTGLGCWGTYAQYMETPANWVFRDDTGLKPEEVATLPMVLITAVRAVRVVGQVKDGDKVLVQAGAAGTGSMQIQVAKALGAEVATTVREEEKVDFARRVGADLVIHTGKEDFVERVLEWTDGRGVDVTIDILGGAILPKSVDATRTLGTIVAVGFVAGTEVTFDIRKFFFGQKQLRGTMAGDVADYLWGMDQVREGRIKPLLDRTLPLSQAAEAHHLIATNQVMGNLVLLPWAD
jgi:NADPH:quinone reductase-like Zn-dependent oxidoreductase